MKKETLTYELRFGPVYKEVEAEEILSTKDAIKLLRKEVGSLDLPRRLIRIMDDTLPGWVFKGGWTIIAIA